MECVKKGIYQFETEEWKVLYFNFKIYKTVSKEAKDLISKML
jgi:hypothetical protein